MEYYTAIKNSRVDFYVWMQNKLQDIQFSEKIQSASGFLVYVHMHMCKYVQETGKYKHMNDCRGNNKLERMGSGN